MPISFPKKGIFNWENSIYIVLDIVYFLDNLIPSPRLVSSPLKPLMCGLLISDLHHSAFFHYSRKMKKGLLLKIMLGTRLVHL